MGDGPVLGSLGAGAAVLGSLSGGGGGSAGAARGPTPLGDYSHFRSRFAGLRERGREVVLELEVDERGRVAEIAVRRSVSAGIDRETAAFARNFQFSPCTDSDGLPVRCAVLWKFTIH